MARVKRAVNAHKKRRTTLELASGYRGQRSRLYRKAKEQVLHSLNYAYRDRRARKGDFRQLWITRINAAARANGMTYNRFVQGLKAAGVEVDRKVLADIAVTDEAAFAALVEVAKANLPAKESAANGVGSLTTQVEPPRTERSARVVAARKLLRRAGRDRAGRFLVEGAQAVREAQRHGRVREVFVTEAAAARHPDAARPRRPRRGSPTGPRRASPTPSRRRASSPSATCSTCRSRAPSRVRRRLVAVLRRGGRSRQRGHGRAGRRRGGRRRRGARGRHRRPAQRQGRAGVHRQRCSTSPSRASATPRAALGALPRGRARHARRRRARRARPARPGGRTGARRARRLDIRWRGARRAGDRCRRADHRVRVPIHGRAESLNLPRPPRYASTRASGARRTTISGLMSETDVMNLLDPDALAAAVAAAREAVRGRGRPRRAGRRQARAPRRPRPAARSPAASSARCRARSAPTRASG